MDISRRGFFATAAAWRSCWRAYQKAFVGISIIIILIDCSCSVINLCSCELCIATAQYFFGNRQELINRNAFEGTAADHHGA